MQSKTDTVEHLYADIYMAYSYAIENIECIIYATKKQKGEKV